MRLEQMYQDVILDHYKHPHHRGLRDPFDAQVHHVNPTCGDEITLRVTLSDDGQTVNDVSYDGQGCSISQAATSVLADEVIGETVGDALKTVTAFQEMISSRGTIAGDEELIGDGVAFAGVAKYPARVKCAREQRPSPLFRRVTCRLPASDADPRPGGGAVLRPQLGRHRGRRGPG